MKDKLIVVCGAGGFIGGHLVADLLKQGHTRIRAVDLIDRLVKNTPLPKG